MTAPASIASHLDSEIDLVRLMESYGLALHPHEDGARVLCSFERDDRVIEITIDPDTNRWRSDDGRSGGVVDFVRLTLELDEEEAVERLLDVAGGLSPEDEAAGVDFDEVFLQRALQHYEKTLLDSPKALQFLRKKGVLNPATLSEFGIGYCDRSFGKTLPSKQLKAGKEIRQALTRSGILRESGHEHFRGSIVVPIRDSDGRVTQAYGHKIGTRLRTGTPIETWLPGATASVWNPEALRGTSVIVTDSIIDGLSVWSAGFQNVIAVLSENDFDKGVLEALEGNQVRELYLSIARRDEDDTEALKLAEMLGKVGLTVFRVGLPVGASIHHLAARVEDPNAALGELLRSAVWMEVSKPPRGPDAAPAAMVPAPVNNPTIPAGVRKQGEVEVSEHEVVLSIGDRRYAARGLERNSGLDSLKVTIRASKDTRVFIDSLDLFSAKHRRSYVQAASDELAVAPETVKKDLGHLILELESILHQKLLSVLPPEPESHALTTSEKEAALGLLRDPDLLNRIENDFETAGLVGENANALLGYLAVTSRLLPKPLGIIIRSSSAAGKSSLMNSILAFVPPEHRVSLSAMTGQSLYYMGQDSLSHRVLAIAEEEGAERASYALKLLQSEGELTIASTGKEPNTGRMTTQEYRVSGPVMLMLTTTSTEVDEELLNRCLVLTVDESPEQTGRIHDAQRQARTLEGQRSRAERQQLRVKHQNAQRLLRPLGVHNPYASRLRFPCCRTRMRRDHEKYLTLLDAITLLHQHQRPVRTTSIGGDSVEYIETTVDDVAVANRLASEVLARGLDDLPPQTRRLLKEISKWALARCEQLALDLTELRFTRRDLGDALGWGSSQLAIHLARLESHEALYVHQGGRGRPRVYELLVLCDDAEARLAGLIDADELRDE